MDPAGGPPDEASTTMARSAVTTSGSASEGGRVTGRGMTMSDLLARHARTRPDAVALRDARVSRTYRQLDGRRSEEQSELQSR